MNNKKILPVFLSFVILFMLCACSVKNKDDLKNSDTLSENDTSYSSERATEPEAAAPEDTTAQNSESFSEDAKPVVESSSVTSSETHSQNAENSNGLPRKKIEHSYGVAKDGKPHSISVNNQQFFDSKGYKALCYDKKSDEKLLYLTFDCGWENGYTSKILDVLKDKNVPATFFCTLDHLKAEPELISRMIKEGHIVGNHSARHSDFSTLTREQMAKEIEDCEKFLKEKFGYTSKYFRFPEGSYSEDALDLVATVGYVSVFWSCSYADWDVNSQKGADYAFEKVTSRLHPGAVILLHSVSPDNAGAMADIIDYARAQGYEFKSLDNYNFG